jgi:hypothetical protein
VLDFLLAGSHDVLPSAATPIPVPDQSQPRPKVDQSRTKPRPVAPEKDFNKRANSLEREALPAGLFPGASKRLYDALYLRTRGAYQASRTVQATRKELMQWSGIKNIKTVNEHLKKLAGQGLIKRMNFIGEHEGSTYEVFLPEEVYLDQTQTSATPDPNRKTVLDQDQKTVWVGSGNPVENKDTSASPKTSFKTNTEIDDEAFAEFTQVMRQTVRNITGKPTSSTDATRWRELAELLTTEFKIAAARTTVSNAPAFLTEHLRRRLWKMDKKQMGGERKAASDEKPSVSAELTKDCPDCGGTGFYYPKGFECGVARCKHEQLTREGK